MNRAMRTVHRQYLPLLEDTIELLIKCYATVQHHKLLESAAQVRTEGVAPGNRGNVVLFCVVAGSGGVW